MSINKILVIGAGTMGLGISQVAARKGFCVFLEDINKEIVRSGISIIKKNLEKLFNKGKINHEEMTKCLNNIKPLEDSEQIRQMDFIIEAVAENIQIKKGVLEKVSKFCREDSIIATNTTSLSVTEISTIIKNPKNFIGMHFFNPVWAMKLVEIIPGIDTSKKTIQFTKELAVNLEKSPVVANESAGGIVSRILGVMINEAIFAFAEGVASAEDIDNAMKFGANLPIGPLHLLDIIGLDIHLAKMETLYREFGDSKYRPHPLLRKMVRGKCLGKKIGKGFFNYQK